MTDHAFLAPSSASMWGPGGCPYSPTMAVLVPEDNDTLEAREGTAAHQYVTEAVLGVVNDIGTVADNGEVMTEEMVDCAQDLINDVASWGVPHTELMVEHRVYMPTIHAENWGTLDIGHVNFFARRIRLRDYKYGHRYVDPYENMQCVDYVVGIANHHGITLDASWTIDIGVYQPRSYHPDGPCKHWWTTGARILELAEGLRLAALEAKEPDPRMNTGPYCLDCSGNLQCPAFLRVAGGALDVSLRGVPQTMTPHAVGVMRTLVATAADRLRAMGESLDARIEADVKAGKVVPGWETGRNPGRTVWAAPVEEVYMMAEIFGLDARKPDALTPKQLRDKAKKQGIEIDEAVISLYTRENTGKTVVMRTAKNAAAKAFK